MENGLPVDQQPTHLPRDPRYWNQEEKSIIHTGRITEETCWEVPGVLRCPSESERSQEMVQGTIKSPQILAENKVNK
ncbi:hypothetical protein Pcinc_033720 [Petrolisthes cinctipes]|uniref:Uncharacterized protein n=1 Tax=Petrolisthes cinctipes TaxID=88211 RepID=A0AAE1ERQ6_PETCI|nr:hypothetical protein Pcinc_033720 [Petrolisthes cinctipes]